MITKRTVLVLGAGASVPFKFPSGLQFLDTICNRLGSKTSLEFKLISECTPEIRDILRFRDALSRSGQPSVDAFLEHRTEFIDIGKTAIAAVLLQYERTPALFESKREQNWYQYLLNLLSTPFEDLNKKRLSIITFNYDRSFEHYLFTSLKNRYHITNQEFVEKLPSIPIIHVHGKLGSLPWEENVREETVGSSNLTKKSVPFDSFQNPDLTSHEDYEWYRKIWIKLARDNIKIIHENSDESVEFYQARKMLKGAERIYFLGFGYHETNLRRLGINDLCNLEDPIREICGTVYGLSHQKREMLKKYRQTPNRLIDLVDVKVYDFFYNHAVLD